MSVTDPTDVHSIGLAEHVEESVEVVAQFHQEHHQAATGLQRAIDRVTTTVGRPRFVIGLAIILGAWVTAAMVVSRGRIEQPAFTWLELAATLTALLVSLLILATQRREDHLAERRAGS